MGGLDKGIGERLFTVSKLKSEKLLSFLKSETDYSNSSSSKI